MDNSEALQLLEELDQIRLKAGMPRMDENSRRDFLKKMGAGAMAAGATVAGMAPGAAQGGDTKADENFRAINRRLDTLGYHLNDILEGFGVLNPQTREDIINQGKISSAIYDVAIELNNIQISINDLILD